jgi:Fanconi anemia group M protein
MVIYINSHEPEEIICLLRKETQVIVKNFKPGDYVLGDIAIERKTINDFLSSLISKRLFKQLNNLKYCYPKCFLLIEVFDLTHLNNIKIIYGAILRIIDMDIKILFSQTKNQTADIILLLYNKNKEISTKTNIVDLNIRNPCFNKITIEMLQTIPNIGKKRANLLLSNFKTLKNIFNADDRNLLFLKGIGKKSVESIKRMLNYEN